MGSGQRDTGPRLGCDYAGYTSMGPDTAIDPGKQVSGVGEESHERFFTHCEYIWREMVFFPFPFLFFLSANTADPREPQKLCDITRE